MAIKYSTTDEYRLGSDFDPLNQREDPPAELKPVKINKVHNGFIVEVGCVTAVFTSRAEMNKELAEYWKDPVKAEKKWCG